MLNTLVQDIYDLLESGKANLDPVRLSNMIVTKLDQQDNKLTLRMSKAGEKCLRKLWYGVNSPEKAEPLPGRVRLHFLNGDLAEETILSLVEQLPNHTIVGRQEEVEIDGVKGHIDGIIDGTVVDVKSANSRGMEKFKYHKLDTDDPFGYRDQLELYYEALKDDPRVTEKGKVAFLAYDKELGHLILDEYPVRNKPWKEILQNIKTELGKPEPPKRYYTDEKDGESGNRQLCLQCRYCDYKNECWKDSNGGAGLRKFLSSQGPKWLTKVLKQPKISEIT